MLPYLFLITLVSFCSVLDYVKLNTKSRKDSLGSTYWFVNHVFVVLDLKQVMTGRHMLIHLIGYHLLKVYVITRKCLLFLEWSQAMSF